MRRYPRAWAGWKQTGVTVLLAMLLAGWWVAPYWAHAQEDVQYFASTGHYLGDEQGFLTYWREHDGAQWMGVPVTEAVSEQGLMVQYFERGRLEWHTELENSPVLPGRVGADYAAALWKTFVPAATHRPAADEYLFEETGYTVHEPFLSFWRTHNGIVSLGYPISEPLWEYVNAQMVQVQYFERGRLEHYPLKRGTPDEVNISSLGRDLALLRGHSLTPLAASAEPEVPEPEVAAASEAQSAGETSAPQLSTDTVEETSLETESVPIQVEASTLPDESTAVVETVALPSPGWGGKRIVVSLSQQWLYAYEGDVLVFDAPVSTGRDGFNTPPGNFTIYAKNPLQTMSGTIRGEYYSVPNVPHAMYINGGVAMHGTYWHNMFGTGVRMSHGCINLPLYSAAWMYDWAAVGTPVQVSY